MQDAMEATAPTTEEGPDWRGLLGKFALIMVAWAVAMHAFTQTFIPPVAIFGVVFAVAAVVIRRSTGKAGPIFHIVASVALLAGSAPFILEALPYPDSPADFVLTGVVGGFVPIAIILGAVGALRRWSGGARVRLWYGTVSLVVVLAAISFIAAAGVEADTIVESDLPLAINGFEFLTDSLTGNAGRLAVFVDNQDAVRHTFTIESLDLEVQLPANTSRRVVLSDVAAGTYEFICSVAGHENMTGTLVVGG